MREYESVRNAAGFIVVNGECRGTVFIVKEPSGDGSWYHYYLVTAKHCIDAIPGDTFEIRFNSREALNQSMQDSWGFVYDRDASAYEVTVDTNWTFHPAGPEVADVAVKPFSFPPGLQRSGIFLRPNVVRTRDFAAGHLACGDEGFIVGLFTRYPGRGRVVPVYRSFHLAAVDNGDPLKVNVAGFEDHESYLIEVRSIGGLSGAPAFLRAAQAWVAPSAMSSIHADKPDRSDRLLLLGLVHGHWDIKANKIREVMERGDDAINSGIAVVTPAKRIIETLDHPELIAMRKKIDQRRRAEESPTPDFATREESNGGRPGLLQAPDGATPDDLLRKALSTPPLPKKAGKKKGRKKR